MNIPVQIIGFFALISSITSYQSKKKRKFLIFQVIANMLYAVQYGILGAYTAFIAVVISTIRSLIFFVYEKDNKAIPTIYLIILELSVVVAGIYTYDNILSIIPVVITILFTYATWQKNLKITYVFGVVASVGWLINNCFVGAYVGCISNIFELMSSFIGYIRLRKYEKNIK